VTGRAAGGRGGSAIRIGLSGWSYAPWRGHFYPKGVTQRQELAYAATRFPALEVNGTFYRLQRPETFRHWAQETPNGFVFAVKASRFITHTKRLRDTEEALAKFFASGVLELGPKLGPLLWQLPPSLRFDSGLMAEFLARLPKGTRSAVHLARRHGADREGLELARANPDRPLRHAVEVRHDSFRDPAFARLLREHDVALVCADTPRWPRLMDLTADFAYCRLHGAVELYRSRYTGAALARWAKRMSAWANGQRMTDGEFIIPPATRTFPREVFVFFDNTDKLHAPDDAMRLMRMAGVEWKVAEKGAA